MRLRVAIAVGGFLGVVCPLGVYAASSTNYRINESVLGGTSSLNSSSANYQSSVSAGTPATGGQYPAGSNGQSTNYQVNGGYETTSDPALSFAVNGGTSINFGSLSTAATSTATSTFNVSDYTSYGYIVQVMGTPPTSGSHTLTAMTGGGPTVGTEQFGINLRANTSPLVGSDASGGLGTYGSGYGTQNSYKYTSSNTIASAPKSSGQTTFTISYIVNAASTTPGGTYTSALTLICTGTY
jgi:hypothetical protein